MTEKELLLHRRGVADPCTKCQGWGVYWYGSTATWMGGMGGAAMTMGVCDTCWGTGDLHRHGVDVRRLYQQLEDLRRESSMRWLANRCGCDLSSMQAATVSAAEALDALSRKRKLPDGVKEFWWRRGIEVLANVMREMASGKVSDEG